MVLILRVDCDNAYVSYGNNLMRKIRLVLNYLNENYFVPHVLSIGYLKHLYKFIEYLEDIGVHYSIFFKYITLPPKDIVKIITEKNEIGLHLYSAKTEKSFLKELKILENKINVKVEGFTKHGDGLVKLSRKHAWRYEPEKYIVWGMKAKLKYFSGNEHGICSEIRIIKRKFLYIPQTFRVEPWARKTGGSIDDVVDHVSTGGCTVALVHPCNWFTNETVQRELENLLSKVQDVISFSLFLRRLSIN